MKCVTLSVARGHFHQLLREVERTRQTILIARRGRRIAALVPYGEAGSAEDERDWLLKEIEEIRASQKSGGPKLRAEDLIEEGRER